MYFGRMSKHTYFVILGTYSFEKANESIMTSLSSGTHLPTPVMAGNVPITVNLSIYLLNKRECLP